MSQVTVHHSVATMDLYFSNPINAIPDHEPGK